MDGPKAFKEIALEGFDLFYCYNVDNIVNYECLFHTFEQKHLFIWIISERKEQQWESSSEFRNISNL